VSEKEAAESVAIMAECKEKYLESKKMFGKRTTFEGMFQRDFVCMRKLLANLSETNRPKGVSACWLYYF